MSAYLLGNAPNLYNADGSPAGQMGLDGVEYPSSVSGAGLTLVSGVWAGVPSIFRLRLTGTGGVTVDAKDRLGAITTGVASYAPSAATNQVEFPFLGAAATQIRVTLTGSATAEVI